MPTEFLSVFTIILAARAVWVHRAGMVPRKTAIIFVALQTASAILLELSADVLILALLLLITGTVEAVTESKRSKSNLAHSSFRVSPTWWSGVCWTCSGSNLLLEARRKEWKGTAVIPDLQLTRRAFPHRDPLVRRLCDCPIDAREVRHQGGIAKARTGLACREPRSPSSVAYFARIRPDKGLATRRFVVVE
jgi:hypothetical protein